MSASVLVTGAGLKRGGGAVPPTTPAPTPVLTPVLTLAADEEPAATAGTAGFVANGNAAEAGAATN